METVNLDSTDRLAGELTRFARLGARAKAMMSTGDFGAEFSALMMLFPLSTHGPMRITDLAEVKGADASTVSRQAAQLVKAGLVRREADPADGRASRLAVTERGADAVRRLHEGRKALLHSVLSGWPQDRIDTFVDLFTDFNSSVEEILRNPSTVSREN